MTIETIQSFPLGAGLTVRIGYADAHVEIAYQASKWGVSLPTVTFRLEAAELAQVPVIFGKAMEHAEKVKGGKS